MMPTSSQMLDAASESPKGINVGSRRCNLRNRNASPPPQIGPEGAAQQSFHTRDLRHKTVDCATLSGLFFFFFAGRDP